MGAQVGIYAGVQDYYGNNPTFNEVTILNTGRNLKTGFYFSDFMGGLSSDQDGWYGQASGAGSGVSVFSAPGTTTRPGIGTLATGTTATGYAGYCSNRAGLTPGAAEYTFESDIYVNALSTAIEEFYFFAGIGDTINADQVDGAYFRYYRPTNVNWEAVTARAGVRTATDTGIAVAAGAWIRLKVVVNMDATQVDFYINGALVASNIANIPNADTGAIVHMLKTVGITTRLAQVDWAWLHWNLLASR